MDEPHERRTNIMKNLGQLKNNNPPCDLRLLPRCVAKAKSSGNPCGNPAMRDKKVCWIHGGKSTGPKTKEGLMKSKTANLKHGKYKKEVLAQRKSLNSLIREFMKLYSQLELL
jgi:hypothetical protein